MTHPSSCSVRSPVWLALSLSLTACFDAPALAPRDAAPRDAPSRLDARRGPGAQEIASLRVLDALGREWPLEAAPRSFSIEIRTTAPLVHGDPEPCLLLRGAPDEALRADLARAPLTAATRARLAPLALSLDAERALLRPSDGPAAPGEEWTFVVGSWATSSEGAQLEASRVERLVVSSDPLAGAALVSSFPADGSLEVPPNLARIVLAIDGQVAVAEEAVRVHDAAGRLVSGRLGLARCEPLGMTSVSCVTWSPVEVLAPSIEHVVETTAALRDATGAAVRGRVVLRVAASIDTSPPTLASPLRCAIDELATSLGCVARTDTTRSIRLALSEPSRLELSIPGRALRELAPRGEARLVIDGLERGRLVEGTLRVVDLADLETTLPLAVETLEELAPLTISEICADPEGPEPSQEWIEVLNVGPGEVLLDGLTLADRADAPGSPITSSRTLPEGGRALLVPDGFDAELAGVPPGATLVRMGRALVPSGLTNSGEPLWLRDEAGQRLAHVPSIAARTGHCVVRDLARGPRADEPGDFHYDACSPGR